MTLKQQVANRQKFVEQIIGFVHDLLTAKGEVLKHETHSSHYYAHRRLIYEKFTFEDEGAFTMFGGEEVTIWFDGFKVFQVKYHDIKECEVQEWDTNMPCPDWQTPLKALRTLGVRRIAAKIDRGNKVTKKQQKNLGELVKAQMDLEANAKRLHLV